MSIIPLGAMGVSAPQSLKERGGINLRNVVITSFDEVKKFGAMPQLASADVANPESQTLTGTKPRSGPSVDMMA